MKLEFVSCIAKVRAGGQEVLVHRTSVGSFAALGCRGAVAIEMGACQNVVR
jgi:hypothetical protein